MRAEWPAAMRYSHRVGIRPLARCGSAAACVVSTGKVFPLARNIKNENRALHQIPVPCDTRLQNLYLSSTLSAEARMARAMMDRNERCKEPGRSHPVNEITAGHTG